MLFYREEREPVPGLHKAGTVNSPKISTKLSSCFLSLFQCFKSTLREPILKSGLVNSECIIAVFKIRAWTAQRLKFTITTSHTVNSLKDYTCFYSNKKVSNKLGAYIIILFFFWPIYSLLPLARDGSYFIFYLIPHYIIIM